MTFIFNVFPINKLAIRLMYRSFQVIMMAVITNLTMKTTSMIIPSPKVSAFNIGNGKIIQIYQMLRKKK